MEQEKTALAAFNLSPVLFSTAKGSLRRTCTQCREQSSQGIARKRGSSFTERPNSFQELEKAEVKQKIKQILSQNNNNELLENSNQGFKFNCTLKIDNFALVKTILKI